MSSLRTSRLVVALLLGACTREKEAEPPAPTPAAQTPAASGIPDFREWRLGARGLGPLVAGTSAADAIRATGGTLSLPPVTEPGQCDYATWTAAPTGIEVMFEDGVLARIDVMAPGFATEEGLAVGNSAARADSLYGAMATRRPHKYEEGEYLTVQLLAPADTIQRLVIEVVNGTVKQFRIGRIPQVEYVEGCS